MLKTSIDELTVVLQATVSEKLNLENNADWEKLANEIITDFEEKANLVNTFGIRNEESNCPNGYTNVLTMESIVFTFVWHTMKVIMKWGLYVSFRLKH